MAIRDLRARLLAGASVGLISSPALWARNLTDDKSITFGAPFPLFATGMYERARTYGVDVTFKY